MLMAGTCLTETAIAQAEPLLVAIPDEATPVPSTVDNDVGPAPALACEPAIESAAAAHEIPADLLLAIGMVESGLTPWVLNAEGTPYFFEDSASAIAELESLQAGGIASIDVGCMQVNLRWHPDAFPDLATAIDPGSNATYAAKFLLSLYAMTGSWTDAVAYYHSSAQRYQRPYVCAVAARLEEMGSAMTLDCQPGDEVDVPQVATTSPSSITPAQSAPPGPQHIIRISPAAGSGPTVIRGQDAPPDATDSAGPPTDSGPRIIRIQ